MRLLALALLRIVGWRPEGEPPRVRRFVLIAAPHTSNWDFPITMALAAVYRVKIRWMGKHTLFWGPFGPVMRALGGIPIHRHERRNVVAEAAALFEQQDTLVLIVPAEGTRGRVERWRSGFYHIARTAGVPVVLGYLDYARKRGGFGPAVEASDDPRAMMDGVRAFYADKAGRRPDNFATPRLKEEDA